jgi:hypothetical protein
MGKRKLWVSTRKGLLLFVENDRGFALQRCAFRGDRVSLCLPSANSTVYAALDLGHFGVKLRKSADDGATWQELKAPAFDPKPDGLVELLPDGKPWPWRVEQLWALEHGRDAQHLYAGCVGGGLFESHDGGQSWSLLRALWEHPLRTQWFGGGADLPAIHSVLVHPTDSARLVVGVSCGGVWHSADAGASFNVRCDGMFAEFMPPEQKFTPHIQDPHMIVQCLSKPDRLYCQHHNGAFRSDDRGLSWTELDVKPSHFGFAVGVHPSKPDTAWFVPAVKDETRVPVDDRLVVARTEDGGKSFAVLSDGLPEAPAFDLVFRHALSVSDDGSTLAMGSTTGSLWIGHEGGERWQEVSAHLPPIYAVRWG